MRNSADGRGISLSFATRQQLQPWSVHPALTAASGFLCQTVGRAGGTGLQYNRARWYDAETGRWISEDPIGFSAGDVNTARYVSNSVVDGRDPSGLRDPDEDDKWPTGPKPPWGSTWDVWDAYRKAPTSIKTPGPGDIFPPILESTGPAAGTPKFPHGHGLYISVGGEFDNPMSLDYAMVGHEPMTWYPVVRPTTRDLKMDTVSHLVLRGTPVDDWPELVRVVEPGGWITISGTEK